MSHHERPRCWHAARVPRDAFASGRRLLARLFDWFVHHHGNFGDSGPARGVELGPYDGLGFFGYDTGAVAASQFLGDDSHPRTGNGTVAGYPPDRTPRLRLAQAEVINNSPLPAPTEGWSGEGTLVWATIEP